MTDHERTLVEAVISYLSDNSNLGLKPDQNATDDNNPKSRGFQYLHGHINEMFAHKTADLVHHTGICAAFSKVHNYKYLDDDTFIEAMDKEMTAQGIPAAERKKALEFIPKIIKELSDESQAWAEKDFGFNPNLDEIMNQPEQ